MSSIAAIDIGSNSVRLLIVGPDRAQLCREMHITRLAEGVDRSGRLAEGAMLRTLAVLERYAELLERHEVKRLRVTGTIADGEGTVAVSSESPGAACADASCEVITELEPLQARLFEAG